MKRAAAVISAVVLVAIATLAPSAAQSPNAFGVPSAEQPQPGAAIKAVPGSRAQGWLAQGRSEVLARHGMVATSDPLAAEAGLPEPAAISLNIAQSCNLSCSYCYADEGRFGGKKRLMPEEVALATFMARCENYFAANGCIVDQPLQPRLPDGMIRCYMGADKVVGFGHQLIKALIPPPPEGPDSPAAQPGPRIMHGADAAPFQTLRAKMEDEWTPQMMRLLGLDAASLPIIWDADFLYGPRTATGEDTYVLCEINVSSCFAIPDQAPAAIALLAMRRLREARAASLRSGAQ
jgi:hypothetical protein